MKEPPPEIRILQNHDRSPKSLVLQFTHALAEPLTYKVHRNSYALFGLLWGLPIPFFAIVIHLAMRGTPLNLDNAFALVLEYPMHCVFLLHPLLFMIVFGALGSIKRHDQDQIEQLVDELHQQSVTDFLTGLFNHRYFQDALHTEFARSQREGKPLAVLMADLDNFKRVNDSHGHQIGDQILKSVGHLFKEGLREYDSAARYGGEEFVVLLPNTGKSEALGIAERFCAQMRQTRLSEKQLQITISIGIACYPDDCNRANELINIADKQLYIAKQQGKDRVSARTADAMKNA